MVQDYLINIANNMLNSIPLTKLGYLVVGLAIFIISMVFIVLFKKSVVRAYVFTKLGIFSLVTFSIGLALCYFEEIIVIYVVAFSVIIFIMSVFIVFMRLILHKVTDFIVIVAIIALFVALVCQLFGFTLIRNIAIIIIAICIAVKTFTLIFKKDSSKDDVTSEDSVKVSIDENNSEV